MKIRLDLDTIFGCVCLCEMGDNNKYVRNFIVYLNPCKYGLNLFETWRLSEINMSHMWI